MTDEGEGGPVASNSWRHRWLPGFLFVLVGLGALAFAWRMLPGEAVEHANRFVRTVAPLRGDRQLALGAIALLWLGMFTLACGRHGATLPRAVRAQAPAQSPLSRSDAGFMRPGRGTELLLLFARPAVAPLSPVGRADDNVAAEALLVERGDVQGDVAPPRMIRLFGPLVVEGSDGRALGQRAVRGLIVYLVVQRTGASAQEMIAALWPDDDPQLARPRLWDVTRRVRALLGGSFVRDGRRYALDPEALGVDAWEVERLCAGDPPLTSLEQALGLAFAPPFADVDYPWVDTERRRLHAVRLDLLARVARGRLDAGEFSRALAAAEELVSADPLHEPGWRLAMEADAALGARRSIIDRYETLTRELDRQLGLRPQSETRATYRRLLGQA